MTRHKSLKPLFVKLCSSGLALLALSANTQGQAQPQPQPPSKADNFVGTMLVTHNSERAAQQLTPLIWDKRLADDAEKWAQHLAKHNIFEHSGTERMAAKQGENLWMGTSGYFKQSDMIQAFIDEKKYYRAGVFPNVSNSGRWSDVGHYTQIIWPDTKKLGCAIATGAGNEFLVCRYWPAGNVIGTPMAPLK